MVNVPAFPTHAIALVNHVVHGQMAVDPKSTVVPALVRPLATQMVNVHVCLLRMCVLVNVVSFLMGVSM